MSKELKALARIRNFMSNNAVHWKQDIAMIETALKEYELMKEIRITARFDLAQVNKEHKALEIIKEKFFTDKPMIYSDLYKYGLCIDAHVSLTEEEYDLLKEVLL